MAVLSSPAPSPPRLLRFRSQRHSSHYMLHLIEPRLTPPILYTYTTHKVGDWYEEIQVVLGPNYSIIGCAG